MLPGLDERTITIYAPIQSRLQTVETRLRSLDEATVPNLKMLLDYVLSTGGKRIRPAMTLLASDFYGPLDESPITMAVGIELLHLATLIHDDTVDDSVMRRGKPTVSHQWGNHVAILLGDYVFSASATWVCDTGNLRVVCRFAETLRQLSTGQISEYFNNYNPEQTRQGYQDRISRKTASLFRTAAECGAILGGAPEPQITALSNYGFSMGIAFQVVDDLLDFQGDPVEMGKPVGNDLMNGILTLPSIMLLERYPTDNPVAAYLKDRTNDRHLDQAIEMVHNSGVVADCYGEVRDYCARGLRELESLPRCEARDSLQALAEYVRERYR